MTILSRRFAASLAVLPVLLLGLAACDAEPDAHAEAPPSAAKFVPGPAAKAQAEALAGREKAQLDWLKKTLDAPAHASVYEAALEQARGRAEHCPDESCLTRALNRRQTRLNFAEGKSPPDKAVSRIPGLPFANGQFARREAGYSGPVRIVPLIDGKAMLVIALSFKDRPSCTLDGVMIRDEDTKTWTVSSLEQGLPTLVMTPREDGTFDLSYAEADHQPYEVDYCTTGTSIDGRYSQAG